VTDVLLDLVSDLGGSLVDAANADAAALPLDLRFGEGAAVFATAPEGTLARSRLVEHLPLLIEHARQRRSALSEEARR
jgi:hypothetical protein